MKKVSVILLMAISFIALGLFGKTYSEEIKKEDCFSCPVCITQLRGWLTGMTKPMAA